MGTELLIVWTAEVGLARVRDNSRDKSQEGVVVVVSEEWFSPHY